MLCTLKDVHVKWPTRWEGRGGLSSREVTLCRSPSDTFLHAPTLSHFAAGGYTFSQHAGRSSSVLLAIEEESDWIPIFEMDIPPGK